jgi:nucleoside-diphosphate-sugar epimerase
MTERVLVTGGTGFVGGWTLVELLRRGYEVRATVRDLARADAVRRAIATQVEPGDRLTFAAADLAADAGWTEAAAGCRFVLHVASPLGGGGDDGGLIAVAREGTLRVLRAAVEAGAKRVVLTSSMAACTPAEPSARAFDETDWADPEQPGLATYRKSKVLAERAAWQFMADKPTQLTTILPGAIFGPVLAKDQQGSVAIIRGLIVGRPPALPRLAFNIVDVRDLAGLHVVAMESPAAAGERFIAMGETMWFDEVARALKTRLGPKGEAVTTRNMPDLAARALALFSKQMRSLMPLLGRTQPFSSDKACLVLGFAPRPAAQTIGDCGESLV